MGVFDCSSLYRLAARLVARSWRRRSRAGVAVWLACSCLFFFFFFKQKTAYEIGLGIPAEPLFRSEEKWLNMLGTFVKDWFRYESHFVHGRDSLVDILKERGLLSESDAVQPLIGKKS